MYQNFTEKLETSSHHRAIFGVLLALLVLSIASLVGAIRNSNESSPLPVVISDEEYANPFGSLTLQANAAFVWDVARQEVLYSLNQDTQLPLASIAKVMTALVVVESLNDDSVVRISSDAIRQEGDSGLLVGEKWKVRDLIDFTLVTSSNDGAAALAQAVSALSSLENVAGIDTTDEVSAEEEQTETPEDLFGQKIQEQIAKIGLDQTFFINESGLDISEGVSGAYSSAHDVAKLFSYVITHHPTLLEATTQLSHSATSLNDIAHEANNTNQVIETFPSAIASKTGFTDMAGGNLAVAFEAGPMRPIVTVVLGSTREERFSDIEQLIWASLHYLQDGAYDARR